MAITTQRDVGEALTRFISELVDRRLEPQQKQLAELIKQVQEKIGRKAAAPKKAAKANGKGEQKTSNRPGVPYGIPEADWPKVAMRRAGGESGLKIAEEYGVTPATVYNTVNRLKRSRQLRRAR